MAPHEIEALVAAEGRAAYLVSLPMLTRSSGQEANVSEGRRQHLCALNKPSEIGFAPCYYALQARRMALASQHGASGSAPTKVSAYSGNLAKCAICRLLSGLTSYQRWQVAHCVLCNAAKAGCNGRRALAMVRFHTSCHVPCFGALQQEDQVPVRRDTRVRRLCASKESVKRRNSWATIQ